MTNDPSEIDPSGEVNAVEKISEHEDILLENRDNVYSAFNSVLDETEKEYDKIDEIGDKLVWALNHDLEDEELEDLINSIFDAAYAPRDDFYKDLRDSVDSQDVIDLFIDLKIEHGTEIERLANEMIKGDLWWSSVSTIIEARGRSNTFRHEINLNKNKNIYFNSDIKSSHYLASHLVSQTKAARNSIGKDVLDEVDVGVLEDLIESCKEIIEEVEEYEEEDPFEVSEKTSEE